MNATNNVNNPPAGDLLILAEFLYDKLPSLVKIKLGLAEFAVLDVHALADVDNFKLAVNANGEHVHQGFGPGTYLLLQVDGLDISDDETGLTAFPLNDTPEAV